MDTEIRPTQTSRLAGTLDESKGRYFDFARSALRKRDVQRMLVNIAIILGLGLYVQLQNGLFFTTRNIEAISVQIVVVTILACAMTLVMIAGHIDLSVSGTVVLSGMVAGLCIQRGIPIWLSFVIATLSGIGVGLVNSFLILVVGITSFIATIGTLYASQGVSALFTNGQPIFNLPLSFNTIGQGQIIGSIPYALPMIVLVVALFVAIQRYTALGRYAAATGSNPQAAFLNGVNVKRTTTLCFVLSGAAAGWGGVVYASRLGNPAPTLDNDLLFQVIVAIVIGGTSLFGGEGTVFGTFLGSVLVGVLNNSLNLLGISTFWQYICLGILLTASVGMDTVLRRDSVRRFRRSLVQSRRDRAIDRSESTQRSGLSDRPRGGDAD